MAPGDVRAPWSLQRPIARDLPLHLLKVKSRNIFAPSSPVIMMMFFIVSYELLSAPSGGTKRRLLRFLPESGALLIDDVRIKQWREVQCDLSPT